MKKRKANHHRQFSREFFRGNRRNLAFSILATVIMAAVNLVLSWQMQELIDIATGAETFLSLPEQTLLSLLLVLGVVLAVAVKCRYQPRFLSRAMGQYKNAIFGELMKKNISAFSGENSAVYISALSNDAAAIETNYLSQITGLIRDGLMFAGALLLMLWYSPLLTLLAALLSALPVAASILTGNRVAQAEKQVSVQNESFMDTLRDSLTGYSVIKSFRAEIQMCRMFGKSVDSVENAKQHRRKLGTIVSGIGAVAGMIAQMGVFLLGAYMVLTGMGITAGTVIVFVQLMNFVLQPIATVPEALAGWKSANALMEKLALALSENTADPGTEIPQALEKAIELEDVSFGYGEKVVLHNITARFEAGKSYAIVGASGSGKSTLLNLLMAGHRDYTGTIRYDGRELGEIHTDSLYELVSLVQQNVFVFNSTILDNVTMFRSFPEAEVHRALALSGLWELVRDRGGDYPCGENGSGLSGGEKQRLSIARSLLRKTPVLLVDEATAALDPKTANLVSGSILDLTGLTRIVVTHSLSEPLLRRYDGILTLKNGRIVESGTFGELMEQKGYFYSLFTVSQE